MKIKHIIVYLELNKDLSGKEFSINFRKLASETKRIFGRDAHVSRERHESECNESSDDKIVGKKSIYSFFCKPEDYKDIEEKVTELEKNTLFLCTDVLIIA